MFLKLGGAGNDSAGTCAQCGGLWYHSRKKFTSKSTETQNNGARLATQ